MTDNTDLSARLKALDHDPEHADKKKRSPIAAVLVLFLAAAIVAWVFYLLAQPRTEAPLGTQTTREFQTRGSAFGDMETTAPRPVVETAPPPVDTPPAQVTVVEAPSNDMAVLLDQLAAMQAEIAALRQTPDAPADDGQSTAMAALQAQIDALQASAEDAQRQADEASRQMQRDLAERDREIARLQGDLQLAHLSQPAMPVYTEDPDRAALEARRAQAEADLAARRNSSMIAIGGSGGGAGGSSAEAAQEAARLDPNEEFVRSAGQPARVERAQIIVNPANTITQGTMIQATLETAMDSTLPGPIRAVVTQDVHSYDGSRRLIPRGSTLIGKYSAGVSIGQNRVMVAWERIILPDNQSVNLSAYGMDEIGRSGVSGRVDSRFGQRFGSAALISLISAVPTIAGSQSDNRTVNDTAERVGTDLANATGAIMGDYLRIPPVIHVQQGSRITVMVDRDLEIF